jgi:preprotein translocase subunit SecD
MFQISYFKSFSIILTCILGILFCIPNFLEDSKIESLPSWLRSTVNLGLELRGGAHLQLEVDLRNVDKEYLSGLIGELRSNLRKTSVRYSSLSIDEQSLAPKIVVNISETDDFQKVKSIIHQIDNKLEVSLTQDGKVVATLAEKVIKDRSKTIIEQSIEVIRRRIDETGTKEPTIISQGENRIVVQLPGIDNPEEIKQRIGKTAKMTFHLVADELSSDNERPKNSSDIQILKEERRDGSFMSIPVKKQISLSGEHLIDASVSTAHDTGEVGVSLRFNSFGARKFAEISANNIGKRFAIVLDGKVITAPVFRSAINDGRAEITGSFDIKEANELALLLRAGSLPAPLKIIEERTIGPSLGLDSIKDGQKGTVVAFILVSIFMFLGYSIFGLFANVALIFNLCLLFSGLSLLQATLTLPGIAGIAMTIGMAVDANVLIYERIKEELKSGIKALSAIEAGYNKAMSTIIDSNLTTLIGAAVLYEFGSGPIRGFGVTLALGIIISMFTALSLTKLITAFWFRNKTIEKLPI